MKGDRVMTLLGILLAFCGGILGAAWGGLNAFIFTGLTGLIGIAIVGAGGTFNWLGIVSFGPVFAPWAAFAGGAAATVYAKKVKLIPSGKDIGLPLGSLKRMDVLLVGGVFAVLGYFVSYYVGQAMPGQIDSGAAAVVTVAVVVKLLFTGELFGKVTEEDKALGGRFSPIAKTAWVPWMAYGVEKLVLALAFGALSAYVTSQMLLDPLTAPVAAFFGFCVSAASLIFLKYGTPIPVTHHITLCAAYATVASGGNIYWGLVAAVVAAFAGDFLAKCFYNYGDVHIDPPGLAIALTSFLALGLGPMLNLYDLPAEVIAGVVILIFAAYSLWELSWIKKHQAKN
jgi:hypothetical protein